MPAILASQRYTDQERRALWRRWTSGHKTFPHRLTWYPIGDDGAADAFMQTAQDVVYVKLRRSIDRAAFRRFYDLGFKGGNFGNDNEHTRGLMVTESMDWTLALGASEENVCSSIATSLVTWEDWISFDAPWETYTRTPWERYKMPA